MAWNTSWLFLPAWLQWVVFAVKRSHEILIRTEGKAWGTTVQPDREPATLSLVPFWNKWGFSRDVFVPESTCEPGGKAFWWEMSLQDPLLEEGHEYLLPLSCRKFSVHRNAISCAKKVGNDLLNLVINARLVPSDYFVRLKKKWSNFFKAE